VSASLAQRHDARILLIQEFGSLDEAVYREAFAQWTPIGLQEARSASEHYPVTLIHNEFASSLSWHCILQFAIITELEIECDKPYVFVNLHLPDAIKCTRKNMDVRVLLEQLSLILESRWLTKPWHQLIVAGDTNCPVAGECSFALGDVLSAHSHAVASFMEKWQLHHASGDIDVPPHERYTHLHYVTKQVSIIDHIFASGRNGVHVRCEVNHEMLVKSDHSPLIARIELSKGRKRRRRAYPPRLQSFESVNMFQALAGELEFENLEEASLGLSRVMDVVRCTPQSRPKQHDFSCLEPYREHIRQCKDPVARKNAIDLFHKEKKRALAKRHCDRFVSKSLGAPREDKSKHTGAIQPLEVNGVATYDAREWKSAFLNYYNELFGDANNSFAHQERELELLRRESSDEPRISVPSFVVRECLAKSRGKTKSAPGPDGVTWRALSLLGDACVESLVRLFEHRLNGDPGHDQHIRMWSDYAMTLIPKRKLANQVKYWRPIAVVSCLQKLYLSTVVYLINELSAPVCDVHLGFSPGHQPAELAEFVRMACSKCSRWDLGFYVLKLDIHRAFDNMRHSGIQSSLSRASCPKRLQLAIMREFWRNRVSLRFQGEVFEHVEVLKGGRQGGSETPDLWKRYLDMAVTDARKRWAAEGLGMHFSDEFDSESFSVDALAWADDVVLMGNDLPVVKRMFVIFAEELAKIGLTLKPESLELLKAGCRRWEVPSFSWECAGGSFEIRLVHELTVLGVKVDQMGRTSTALNHRISQAWVHWNFRKKVLCDRRLPLLKRWSRIRETIWRTVLYGSGAWYLSNAELTQLQTFENKTLMASLARSKRDDESDEEFFTRMHRKLNFLRESCGWVSLPEIALEQQFCFWGHVVRMHINTPLRKLLFWRDDSWWQKVKHIPKRPRMATQGTHYESPTGLLYQLLGPDWASLCLDRRVWYELRCKALRGVVHGSWIRSPMHMNRMDSLHHISNKASALCMGRRMHTCCAVSLVVDNEMVAMQSVGQWVSQERDPAQPYIAHLRWGLHVLAHVWKCLPAGGWHHLINHVPRDHNILADALANKVLDSSENCLMYRSKVRAQAGDSFLCFCDGASRGNPGPSSAAAILVQCKADGSYVPVTYKALRLGVTTSVRAELEAACLGLDILACFLAESKLCSNW
jgi:ribonuclease HI